MATKKTNTPEAGQEPASPVQCPVVDDNGDRCLFEEHDNGDHAFTEEQAAAIEAATGATGSNEGAEGAPVAGADGDVAGEAPGEAPEASEIAAVTPARVSENAWWCGVAGCDTSMPHDMVACARCKTPRA